MFSFSLAFATILLKSQLAFTSRIVQSSQHKSSNSVVLLAEKNNLEKLTSHKNNLVFPNEPESVTIKELVPLTLSQAISLAINNNRQLAISKLELNRSRALLDAEKALLFPSLGVQSTLNRASAPSGEIQTDLSRDILGEQLATQQAIINNLETQLANSTDPLERLVLQDQLQQTINARTQTQNQLDDQDNFATTTINGSVGLQYALFSPQRQASIKIAREAVIFQQLEIQRITQNLILNVTNAYYDLQQADREVEIAETDVTSRQKGLAIVQKLLNAALATRLDLLNVEVELDNALQVLRNAQAQQQIVRRNLAEILSLSSQITPIAADIVQVSGEWNLALEDTIILALKNRVELEQQLVQRRISKAQRQEAFAAIKPQLNLFANYDFLQLYSDEPGSDILRGFGDGYSLGMTFNWTFWDGGAAIARAKAAKADIVITEEQYADNAEQIRLEIEQAYYQLPATLQNVKTATLALERAKEAVEAANKRFSASLNTQTEVLDAQNRLVQAKNNLIQAIIGYNRALASLKRAVGEVRWQKD